MRPLWPRRQALSKCLRSLVMWLRRSLELNAATRVVLSVAPIGTRVVLSVVSIAMSVERYADTATESITRSRILLAAKSKRTPRLRIQGRGVLLASVIRPSLSKTDDFKNCERADRGSRYSCLDPHPEVRELLGRRDACPRFSHSHPTDDTSCRSRVFSRPAALAKSTTDCIDSGRIRCIYRAHSALPSPCHSPSGP